MQTRSRQVAIVVLFLLLAGCTTPGLDPVAPPPIQNPTETLDFTDARATLTIVRTQTYALGHFTMTAAVPLLFAIDMNDAEQPVIVWGMASGTAVMNGTVSGTAGSYTVTADFPVEYEVTGSLIPGRDVCRLILDVDETLLLSQDTILHTDKIGDFPIPGSVDEFTTFSKLKFTEIESTVTLGDATMQSVFTIDDWCLPSTTYCTYGCPTE